jgi:polyisoprenoid-binding protein YceI
VVLPVWIHGCPGENMIKLLTILVVLSATSVLASEQSAAVYKIDARESRADILVFKGGKLARFGHDHVISTTDISGSVELTEDFADSTASILVALDSLEVDRQELRNEYGMDMEVSKSAKMGTRKNMLVKVLESNKWPDVSVVMTVNEFSLPETTLNLKFTLHGVTRDFVVPAAMQITEEAVQVQGSFDLLQTDYGIKPFSQMFGALWVQDRVTIHFNLVADRQISNTQDQ